MNCCKYRSSNVQGSSKQVIKVSTEGPTQSCITNIDQETLTFYIRLCINIEIANDENLKNTSKITK